MKKSMTKVTTGIFEKPALSEPNEQGFQFGVNRELTEYANREQISSGLPALSGWKVLEVWKNDKLQAYLVVDDKNNVKQDCTGFESTACALDKYKLVQECC